MSTWYFSYNGEQFGPYDQVQALAKAQDNPNGYAWREGYTDWLPIQQIDELQKHQLINHLAPPPLTRQASDEIDFKIYGHEMEFVEIELDPGESAVAEAGAMMYKSPDIELQTIFGDGSQKDTGSFTDKLLGAGKRLITGENIFTTVFTHKGQGKAHVAFGAPFPGNIIPVTLANIGGVLICQKDSFLCAARGVSIGVHFQKKILTGLFGGEGFVMQRLEGDGLAFVHAGGTIIEKEMQSGEILHVDTGCIVAMTQEVGFDIQSVGGIKSSLFGGEGLFLAVLKGPGKIWLQSLPFSRLAGRMLSAAPQRGGSRGEGSVLGGLGDLIGGDNRY